MEQSNSESGEATTVSTINLMSLPDDCLLKIFEHLPLFDKHQLRRVSRRWRDLLDESLLIQKAREAKLPLSAFPIARPELTDDEDESEEIVNPGFNYLNIDDADDDDDDDNLYENCIDDFDDCLSMCGSFNDDGSLEDYDESDRDFSSGDDMDGY